MKVEQPICDENQSKFIVRIPRINQGQCNGFGWSCYFGGWTMAVVHLVLIATTWIDPMSGPATGTMAMLSWFLGWSFFYYYSENGNFLTMHPRMVGETTILFVALFQLAVGAFAFSRLYNGPLLGHPRDVFQTLSSIYMEEWRDSQSSSSSHQSSWVSALTNPVIDWWIDSSQQRFIGLGWYICDIADIIVHQLPFLWMCLLISKQNEGWAMIQQESKKTHIWILSILAGPMHRTVWDYCTCGHSFCDGPYRGFLQEIGQLEQFLWHFLPSAILVLYLRAKTKNTSVSVLKRSILDAKEK